MVSINPQVVDSRQLQDGWPSLVHWFLHRAVYRHTLTGIKDVNPARANLTNNFFGVERDRAWDPSCCPMHLHNWPGPPIEATRQALPGLTASSDEL